jgi:hypothetical protein
MPPVRVNSLVGTEHSGGGNPLHPRPAVLIVEWIGCIK